MGKFIDLTGQRFGRLVALERAEGRDGPTRWTCLCDCGSRVTVHGHHLRSGNTRSCGCYQMERRSEIARGRRGPRHPSWIEVPSYAVMHMRLRRSRGAASDYPCADCGDQARDWSLRRDASTSLWGKCNRGYSVEYSTNPDDYEPRCKRCHAKHDADARGVRI